MWLRRWRAARFVNRRLDDNEWYTDNKARLAWRAGQAATLAWRPGIKTYVQDRAWEQYAFRLADSDTDWAATGAFAANRLCLSATAIWPVFYVDNVERTAQALQLRSGTQIGPQVSLIPFDGVAEVGVIRDTDGLRWAAPLQVLIDCYGGADRMIEQADALAEQMGLGQVA